MKKNILITGHTKGIGNALWRILENEHQLTGIARNNIDSTHKQYQADLSTETDIKKICEKIKSQNYDIIILNAGYNDIKPPEAYSIDEIIKILHVNFTSHAAIIRACITNLLKNNGHIIALGSFSANEIKKFNNYYGASKNALQHLLKNLFEQYRNQGLKVTTIIPDITNSNFYDHQQYEPINDPLKSINPEEVANLISTIINSNNNFVTNEIIIRPQQFELKRK